MNVFEIGGPRTVFTDTPNVGTFVGHEVITLATCVRYEAHFTEVGDQVRVDVFGLRVDGRPPAVLAAVFTEDRAAARDAAYDAAHQDLSAIART